MTAEKHYVSRDEQKDGLLPAVQGEIEPKLYDTFDCPFCGCQNIVQSRKRILQTIAIIGEEDEQNDN